MCQEGIYIKMWQLPSPPRPKRYRLTVPSKAAASQKRGWKHPLPILAILYLQPKAFPYTPSQWVFLPVADIPMSQGPPRCLPRTV